MTKAIRWITLSLSRDIPFNKLVLSQSTACCVNAGVLIEQLAGSSGRSTLLQSLNVRAVLMEGRSIFIPDEGLQLRRVRLIELSGFTGATRSRLKAYGLLHGIVSWKLPMFVPTDAAGIGVSAEVLRIACIGEREVA